MSEVNPETTILGETLNTPASTDPASMPTTPSTPDPAQGEWMAKYVGEGKKYKTPEDVAKAYANLETFVETVKGEKAELATQLETALAQQKSADDILAELRQANQPTPPVTPVVEQPNQEVTPVDIEAQVLAALAKRDADTKRKAAEAEVWSKLDSTFDGRDNAKEVVAKYIGNDEGRKQVFQTLGLTDPEALVNLLKTRAVEAPVIPTEEPTAQVNTAVVDSSQLTWAKAQAIRKADKKYYNSRAFQVALHKAGNDNPNFWR